MTQPFAHPSTVLPAQHRAASFLAMLSFITLALVATTGSDPMLVSRLGLRAEVAQSIARAVEALGHVPWWALLIIGGGVAGVLVRLVIRYGWRYAAAW